MFDDQMSFFDHWSIAWNKILIFFCPFSIYLLSIIKLLMVKLIFYVSHCHFLFDNKMHILNLWFIDPNNLSISFRLFHIYYITIIKWFIGKRFKVFFSSIDHIILQSTFIILLLQIYFGFLIFIETPLIVDLFITIGQICAIWSWNLSLGVL